MKDYTNYSLLHHNTFHLDVKADRFVEYDTLEELQAFLSDCPENMPLFHIGEGSNLLFTGNYHGIVLHSHLRTIENVTENNDNVILRVGAGMNWDEFVACCISHGYYGLENLSLIPGEVGASAVQNIGAYGEEAGNLIVAVETVELATGHRKRITHKDCGYAYRYSHFKGPWRGRYAVTHVEYRLQKNFRPNLNYAPIRLYAESVGCNRLSPLQLREKIIEIRKAKLPDPKEVGNAGSFFMNPALSEAEYKRLQLENPQTEVPGFKMGENIKVPAGWLIEQVGWKGRNLGKAGVYGKQALVLVNLGGATAEDIQRLSHQICKDVNDRFGITLQPEVNWI